MLDYVNVSLSCGGTPLLENVNVSFNKGKLTTIIGPNGCGKTTLIQALNGLSKVTEGSILLDGTDYLALSPGKRARLLSFLPQVRQTIPTLSVKNLVSHGRFPYLGFSRRMTDHDREAVINAMRRAEVEEYAEKGADILSGGVRQRAFIALQIAQDCECIVADEPTTYLDAPSRRKILGIYSGLRDEGKTVVLVLHDIESALEISDEIIVMNERKIVSKAAPWSIETADAIEDVFGYKIKRFEDEEGKYCVLTPVRSV